MIELIISMAIVGLLATMGVLSFSGHNKIQRFENSVKLLEQNIVSLKIKASAGEVINEIPVKMYGLAVAENKTEYTLFSDLDGNCILNDTDIIDKVIELPENLAFVSFTVDGFCFEANKLQENVCGYGGSCDVFGNYTLYLQSFDINKAARMGVGGGTGTITIDYFDL